MRKALETLIELQEIDRQLHQLYKEKGDLPQKVEILNVELEKIKQELAQKQQESAEKSAHKNTNLVEIDALEERIKKYGKQLFQVKNNKEYDAITTETENTQNMIDDYKLANMAIEDREKELSVHIAQLQEKYEELTVNLDETQTALQKMQEKTQAQEQSLLSAREKVLSALSRPVISTYERIRIGKGGIAVAFLKDGSCSECSTRIPPQRSMEIRNMDTLFYCEVCGRILVWRQESEHETIIVP